MPNLLFRRMVSSTKIILLVAIMQTNTEMILWDEY